MHYLMYKEEKISFRRSICFLPIQKDDKPFTEMEEQAIEDNKLASKKKVSRKAIQVTINFLTSFSGFKKDQGERPV